MAARDVELVVRFRILALLSGRSQPTHRQLLMVIQLILFVEVPSDILV